MAGRLAVALLAALLVSGAAVPALGGVGFHDRPDGPTHLSDHAATGDYPRIVAAYPDPVRTGDAGEFVVLSFPSGVDGGRYELADEQGAVSLGNVTTAGRVAVSPDLAIARNHTDLPVAETGSLSLANGGETLAVRRNGTVVDEVVYRDAREGSVVRWNGTRPEWRPLGATDRSPVRAAGGEVRAFALPDAPSVPTDVLAEADERILLAGYTLSSEHVADALVRAQERGATVRVLVEGAPVGGRTGREAAVLDRLVAAGVEVRAMGGQAARYDYHHAKYAVVDDRAVVLTENWKPAGTGGNSSRGWGVVTQQSAVVEGLAETFRADAGWRDARPWAEYRRGRTFERDERAVGDYPTRFEPETVPVNETTLLLAPDNARPRIVERLDGAEESVDVVQVTLGDWDDPLVRALRRAADRGVVVRVLLSDAWYVREENERTAERLREWADDRDARLSVRLADSGDRFEKIHAKGAVVDGEHVVVGSLNWNDAAATSNREVVLVLSGTAAADYFGAVFAHDWRGGSPRLPVGVLAALAGLLVLAVVVALRMEFAGSDAVGVGPAD